MGLIALIIAWQSRVSYKKTADVSLQYFVLVFIFFSLYLLTLSILSLLYEFYTIGRVFDIGYALARFFIVMGIVCLFHTSTFQSYSVLNRYRVFITTSLVLLGLAALYVQATNFQNPIVSSSNILIQPVEIVPAIVAAIITYTAALSWTILAARSLPQSASNFFKLKTYLIGLGGMALATGDTMYVFATQIPDNPYGPIINLLGYILVIFAISMPSLRRIFLKTEV
jgi:hypothetical protein